VTTRLDETHDPAARSWVASANAADTDFPIQNLPFGVFLRADEEEPRVGLRIGDEVLDLRRCFEAGLLDDVEGRQDLALACEMHFLNALMLHGRQASRALRRAAARLLRDGVNDATRGRMEECLAPAADVTMLVPALVGNYTDFYASVHHATNVGSMFRPDNPLLPNYKWVPIGYHGRASSVVVSGTEVPRPSGQTRDDPNAPPVFGPSRRLDYELEVGAFVAGWSELGETVPIASAEERIFGVCLVNDWSARDLQTWEYQPLGPFLAKSFATTVSPWVVTLDALEPFRIPRAARAAGDPAPLPYLDDAEDRERGGIDVTLEVLLSSARMRDQGMPPHRVSLGSFRHMYWTLAQMLTHHASNGCNLQPGDLLASGTVSGPEKESRGCLLERTWRGTEPIELPTGEVRRFLEDGDEVVMRGWCEKAGYRRVGLGECRGVVASGVERRASS
jgi:fumarylacetoacetase